MSVAEQRGWIRRMEVAQRRGEQLPADFFERTWEMERRLLIAFRRRTYRLRRMAA